MKFSKLEYSQQDQALQDKLNSMFSQLKISLDESELKNGRTSDDIVADGFFPHYSSQRCKVLFVGRESLGLTGLNYIDLIHYSYTEEKAIGTQGLNQHRFHSLMLYIAYALNNGYPEWDNIPYATEIADNFATGKGVSFAFMNYSKLSNDSDNWQADWDLINSYEKALENASSNFYSEQIDILQPDIILTMNLGDKLKNLGELEPLEYGQVASYYRLKTDQGNFLLVDLYHFSATKSMNDCYYQPILKGLDKYGFEQ